jgi:hypothetical protein
MGRFWIGHASKKGKRKQEQQTPDKFPKEK